MLTIPGPPTILIWQVLQEQARATWADELAFERHVCGADGRGANPAESPGAPAVLPTAPDEPSTCAVLLCAGGGIATLERILAHLTQGPNSPDGVAGAVLVISDSGGTGR